MQNRSQTNDLAFLSLTELSELIRSRKVSPVEVTRNILERIERLHPALNAYITVTRDVAIKSAQEAESEIQHKKWRGPLHGVPVAVKDLFDTIGIKTTAGSAVFKDRVPDKDAEVIRKLKAAGAVLVGKTNMHEFAFGGSSLVTYFGGVHNPWNLDRITGGSSGGSAAAVAAGLCAFALGSDTGGSIRNPAALCGIVGLKPTHGRISLVGVCPNVLTFDHLGPMTRTARDAALVLQALAGHDPRDSTSRDVPVPDYTANWERGVRGLRLILCPDFYTNAEVDAAVERAFESAIVVLQDLGAKVETVPFAHGSRLLDVFRVVAGPEYAEFHRPFFTKNPDGYGKDVRERLAWSFDITSDQYVRGLRERELLRRATAEMFRGADALLLPSMPCTAPPIATLKARVNGKEYDGAWIHRPFLSSHNLTGYPAISVPMGFDAEGLPLSLQIVGPEWSEARALAIAHAFEDATPEIRSRKPKL